MIKNANIKFIENTVPFSLDFNDFYFNTDGGGRESKYVFLQGNNLPNRWQNEDSFIVLETGFGTGLNFFIFCELWKKSKNKPKKIHFISIEKYPIRKEDLEKIYKNFDFQDSIKEELLDNYPPLINGIHRLFFENGDIVLDLCYGDILKVLPELSFRADALFLDGFSPNKNEEMWSQNVIENISSLCKQGTTLSTFTASSKIQKNLEKCHFKITKTQGFGKKREMITAVYIKENSENLYPWFLPPNILNVEKNAIVIGAGVAGCSVAFSLAKRHWQVVLLDKNDDIALEGSGNYCGAIMPLITKPEISLGEFYIKAFSYTKSIFKEYLKDKQSGLNGAFQYIYDEKYEARFEIWEKIKHPFFDCLKQTNTKMKAFFIKEGGWARPRKICKTLGKNENIKFMPNSNVEKIMYFDGNWQVFLKDIKLPLKTKALIICMGANSFKIIKNEIEFKKLRGQVSHSKTVLNTNVPHSAQGYICPSFNDKQVLGATYKRDDEDINVRLEDHLENLENLKSILGEEIVEKINPLSLEGRVSFRCSSMDRFPIVGPLGDDEEYKKTYKGLLWHKNKKNHPKAPYLTNLYISTAHGSRGLVSAPFAGEIIASMLNNEPIPLEKKLLNEIHPMRYVIRKLKKGLV